MVAVGSSYTPGQNPDTSPAGGGTVTNVPNSYGPTGGPSTYTYQARDVAFFVKVHDPAAAADGDALTFLT